MSEFGAPNFRRVGQSALVLECAERDIATQRRLWAIARAARTWRHVREAVAGLGNVTLAFEPDAISYEALCDALQRAWPNAREDAATRTIEIPVRYDGEDLQVIADACGLPPDEVVTLHASGTYVVSLVGFLPGFAYLDGLDARLHLPRRDKPRMRVPAGSVGIAGSQSGVYPFDSPGGWHIVGRTALRMFDPSRDPTALLQPGDTVRFVAV